MKATKTQKTIAHSNHPFAGWVFYAGVGFVQPPNHKIIILDDGSFMYSGTGIENEEEWLALAKLHYPIFNAYRKEKVKIT